MKVRTISVLCLAALMSWAASAFGAVGGPDRFGYGWADSDEADVTYEWLDAGTTTCVTLNDDQQTAAIPMGFTFSFYGADYTDAYIGSNGYVSFQVNDVSTGYGGQCPLPVAAAAPNLAIYGFYQDLDPTEGGTICYATLGEVGSRTFVVSYVGIDYCQGDPPFGSDPVTFQIVLYEGTNEAQVNIQESGTTAGLPRWYDNASIGIENADGTLGLGLCDWTSLHLIPDEYAVRFRASDSFGIFPGLQTGTLPPGGTSTFDFEVLNFSSAAVTTDLSASGTTGWTATPTPGSVTVAAGSTGAPGSTAFTVDVTAPAAAVNGDQGTITVDATGGTSTSEATIRLWATHGDSEWQTAADLPEALQNVILLADDDYVYSITGESIDDSSGTALRVLTNKAMRWDPAVNGWDDCAVADLPTPVTLGGACIMNGHIYYVGGLTQLADAGPPATPAFYLETLLDYDIAANTWTERNGPAFMVMSPVVACDATSNTVFVYGGYVDVNHNGEVEIPSDTEPDNPDRTVALFQAYDVAADSWEDSDSGTLTTADEDHGYTNAVTAVLDGDLYITAGSFAQQDDTTGRWLSYITRSTSIYDIAANTWSDGPWFPTFVSDRAGVVFRDELCALGGLATNDEGTATVIIQDWWCLNGDTWVQQTNPLSDPVYSYGAAVLDDFVYVAGGQNDADELVAVNRRWPTDTALPAAIPPVIDCGGPDADADGDADTDGGEDIAADADADTGADADAPTETTTDTAADGGGGDDDDGCGCRVTSRSGAGTFLSLLFVLGAALVARRRRG